MGSTNCPNSDPSTKPRDAGAEPWADDRPDTEDRAKRRPVANPVAPPEEGAPNRGLTSGPVPD